MLSGQLLVLPPWALDHLVQVVQIACLLCCPFRSQRLGEAQRRPLPTTRLQRSAARAIGWVGRSTVMARSKAGTISLGRSPAG
ncbi:hypothetical protein [Thermogemmatispora tikiterensis]|uniref:Uncharacterized protein n=1 Tax=Thermogemmatispora tikiterensis TaxID=1825093 RepID=A0A328VQZ0_9CHLR|nr:hypothetical protein [Thermogemmatispora tikiterensis]RAQ97634.1 hypothetical protein A4R35_19000 [Thermogemmatispora tikiterensis]